MGARIRRPGAIAGALAVALTSLSLVFAPPARAADESITIVKQAAGTPFTGSPAFDFTYTEEPGVLLDTPTLVPGGSEDYEAAPETNYTIAEIAMPTYWTLSDIDCTSSLAQDGTPNTYFPDSVLVALEENEQVVCTFTNTYAPPPLTTGTIQIATATEGDPYPGTPEFAFSGAIDTTLGPDASSSAKSVSIGGNTVTQGALPEGWSLADITCTSDQTPDASSNLIDTAAGSVVMNVSANEDVVCTFLYAYLAQGRIVVETITHPGGDGTAFDFELSGPVSRSFDLSGGGPAFDSGPIDAGIYALTENVPAGWAQTGAVCDDGSDPSAIGLADGETVICTFTNTQLGTITVVAKAQDLGRGSDLQALRAARAPKVSAATAAGTFSFKGAISATLDPGERASARVLPGTYSVTQVHESDWDVSAISCTDGNSRGNPSTRTAVFQVRAGESVRCSFRNVEVAAAPDGGSPDGTGSQGDQAAVLPETGASALRFLGLGMWLIVAGLASAFLARIRSQQPWARENL